MLICGNVVKTHLSSKNRSEMLDRGYQYLRMHKINGFCTLIDNVELSKGVAAMLSVSGVGKMRPNILLMGFKNDWRTIERHTLDEYFASIQSVWPSVFIF